MASGSSHAQSNRTSRSAVPDSGSRKAGLRLDTYEGATALTKEGLRAIDPGHADKSLLLFRINHKDPEMVMPTPESNLTLTDRER